MKKIRLLIIEDNRLLREGIALMIDQQVDLKVVGALDNKDKLEPKILETKPDIVLIDHCLQGKHCLRIVKTTKQNFPDMKFIVMALLPIQEDVFEFVKAGASGFILKDAGVNEFLQTIRSVFSGKKVLPSHLTGSLFSQIVSDALITVEESRLIRSVRMTKREKQLIASVAEGLTNKEIGQEFHLSLYTVKSHIHNIFEKLAIHTRIEIAKYAHSDKELMNIKPYIPIIANKEKQC
ncbi:MAG: response regulator transcription factor [Bacteroidota bacterium]|nr:response regulator transcription factor [Bacteroidota bacterium]